MKTQRTTPLTILLVALIACGVRATQRKYLQLLLTLWLVIPGNYNFTNLARYHRTTERTHRKWFQKAVPWVQLGSHLVLQAQDQKILSQKGIVAIDAVFIPKYGKATPDLASFWSGCQQRSLPGLEGSCVTWVDSVTQQPVPLSITQTPAELPEGQTRADFYATTLVNACIQLPTALREQIEAVVGDAYYTKKNFVQRVVDEAQLSFVGKGRKDFNLKHPYTGPRTGKRGRPKVYDGKVSLTDFSRWDAIPYAGECTVYTTIAYAVSLKRWIRVVALLWPKTTGKRCRLELLFSTDTNMEAATIIRLYRARFAMEFPFRDGKQFAGLSDCQSRQTEAIHFHWNMSLLAVTTARLSALSNHKTGPFIFSMEDEKRRSYNCFFAQRIISSLGYATKVMEMGEPLRQLLGLGVKAA